ncbi:hypothetical protein [Ramlibacter sp. PS4R-6]|uniref:hypothetical protein n=1 Tax=Ramlibacter sp. PS4R-6 TaxID=3133438 RepID=UPI0030B294BF
MASIAGATVAMANVPVGQWSTDLSLSDEVTSPASPGKLERAPGTEAPTSRSKARCRTCGVVESIRKVDAAGATPAVYEFTIRLRDGSARVSSVASVAKWRVGDPVMLIGGNEPSSNNPVSL